jgi:hypothetical protein
MKSKLIAFATLFGSIFAAPVENTSAPQLIEEGFFISRDSLVDFRAGYEGDFVADARMQQHEVSSGRVDSYEQETNSGTVTLNFLDRLDVYGLCGSSRTCADWRFTISGDVHRAQLETLYSFLWGVGARGILYESGCFAFGMGGRFEHSKYDNLWMTIDGIVQQVSGTELHWRVWQIDVDMSYKIDIFTPYIGIKYSNVRSGVGVFSTPISNSGVGMNFFENRTPVGVFIGCSLSSGKYFMLNIEGRLIDEEAVTISGDFRF